MPSLLDFTYNTRDIGGYRAAEGKFIKYSAFWRSDLPNEITDCDVAAMISVGMTDVIDLRSHEEVKCQPCALAVVKGLNYKHCALAGDGRVPDSPEGVAASYMEIADGHAVMSEVMRCIARSKGGVVCHCTAGKDRTGVVTAILMMLVGVSDEDISENYMQSEPNLRGLVEELCRSYSDLDREVITPKRRYIEEFLGLFRQKYTNAESYMYAIGLKKSEIRLIVNKLI